MSLRPVRSATALLVCLSLLLVAGSAVVAQESGGMTSPEDRLAGFAEHQAMAAASPFKHLPWQFVGPTNVSGRMTDVDVVAPKGSSYTIYVAGASGGVWRTKNEGITWEPIFDQEISTSIGDVTLAPSNPDIVWVGTGEANIFRSSMAGAGVWRSTDAGETWEHKGLTGTHTIPRIVIHPTNPDVVYVAASGHEWTNNEERGVYKSTDGGDTWDKIHYVDDRTGAIDLVMDPSDPETLYASTWQRIRKKWNDPRNEPTTSGSGVWKSTDAGATWTAINEGLPAAEHRGRIGIDVAASSPNVVYAFVDNYEVARMPGADETDAYGRPRAPVIKGATVFRSDDGGASWRQTSENNAYMQGLGGTYGWVFGQMRVDPTDADKIYVMGLALNVSEDSGRTFRRLPGMHGDHHGLWIDPDNPDYLVNVNDGGVAISYDAGDNWRTFYDNAPLVQFFNVAADTSDPFWVYGSIQDHGSRRGLVDLSRGRHAIPAVDFENAPGGEGSSHAIDPTDPDTVYAAGFYGNIFRSDLAAGERASIVPQPGEGEPPLRGQWVAPFIISPHNPRIIYHGMNFLYRSMDRGDRWERLSPDLTFNELDKIGDISYQTIFSISESPLKFGLVYVGTDDGRVWVTEGGSGADAFTEITGELPRDRFISEIVASAYDVDTVFLSQNGKRDDDFKPYLWRSADRGSTWQDLAEGIPYGPINVVKEDPKNSNILYVGTDVGAYVTLDGGGSWHVLAGGLPSTFVHDMVIHPRDDILVAATHGRGIWALDVRPIQALSEEARGKAVHLLGAEDVVGGGGGGFGGFFGGGGGASTAVHYWLGAATDVTIEVRNDAGEVVRTLDGSGDAGHNMVVWDTSIDGEPIRRGRFTIPPRARPGTYTVAVVAGDASAETRVEIRSGD